MLDLPTAVANLGREAIGDWHRDPWGWPEYNFLLKNPKLVYDQLNSDAVFAIAQVDVPKENFASRPAMVLDPLDRLAYTALVDYFSVKLIGDLSPHVYGWRLNTETPVKGKYERNSDEWDRFRHHLLATAADFETLLVTDIVSCFANISVSQLNDTLQNLLPDGIPLQRLSLMLKGWEDSSGRAGIPQRSSASAVLANAYMRNLDLVLNGESKQVGRASRGEPKTYSWARWMDDMWLFGDDAGTLRRAQVKLQGEAEALGLNLNSSKTELLEGPSAVQRALEMEHSAVDEELIFEDFVASVPDRRDGRRKKKMRNETPRLDAMIDDILLNRDKVSRTTLRFASTRMRKYRKFRRVPELLDSAYRMPHGADHLARLFRESVGVADFQDWFLDYTKSPWATYEWSTANFGTVIRAGGKQPRKATRDFFAQVLADGRTSLPLFSLSAQRLSEWDPDTCRLALREAVRTTTNPHHLRVAALAGIASGEPRATAKRWLSARENRLTLEMLEARSFRALSPTKDYAGHED